MRLSIPSIYPITDTAISGISHAEQVRRLINGGARFIQLREKSRMPSEWIDDALEAITIAHGSGAKIIVNDRVDIAMTIGADGVHLGQDDVPPNEARKLLGYDSIIGFSTHTIDQATEAAELEIDYVAFGPVFPTQTKSAPDPVVGLDLLRAVKNITQNIPLVAIGGIDETNLAEVLGAGADTAAIIGAIVSDADAISQNYAALNNIAVIVAAHHEYPHPDG